LDAANHLKAGELPVAVDGFLTATALCSAIGDDEKAELAWRGVATALERRSRATLRQDDLVRMRTRFEVTPPRNAEVRRRVVHAIEATGRHPDRRRIHDD
jgi:hypothetical protein